jgi:carbonic anhydrase/acetyltransferase-like protein (isoleucine patch superfamily)
MLPIVEYLGKVAKIHPTAYVSPNAFVSGAVEVGERGAIFDYAVVRGDFSSIKIGKNSNVQDCCSVHAATTEAIIGDNVTVGHGAVIHGAKIGNMVIVGINSTVLDGAEIGDNCIIGAGTVITPNTKIPPKSLVVGNPGKVAKEVSETHLAAIKFSAESYSQLAQNYKKIIKKT